MPSGTGYFGETSRRPELMLPRRRRRRGPFRIFSPEEEMGLAEEAALEMGLPLTDDERKFFADIFATS